MLSLEKLANANIKNRAEYTQLTTDLTRLEKEKRNDLRMLNNEIQRFKARYSKTNFTADSPQASNVKMYETHNPGFCFKRNGEHRGQQASEQNSSVDFEHLHFLLFTDGEVDIEKILCLHLLSSHETDHLTPPRRPRTSSNFTKKDSPLEQIIERSKDNSKEVDVSGILPTYVVDVHKENSKRSLMDERLSARLLVNEKILELIMTVVTALETSNPEKVRHLISIAEDPSSLKRIFRKQHIQDFVMTLKEHSLVNSCSSFVLTQPYKIKPNHLEIRTTSGALEDLIRSIRSGVLQFPKPGNWGTLENESREILTIEHSPITSKSSVSSSKQSNILKSGGKPSEIIKEGRLDSTSKFRRSNVNFIKKNVESIPLYRRSIEEEEELPIIHSRRKQSFESDKKPEKSDEKILKAGSRNQSIDSGKRSSGSRRTSLESSKKNFGSRTPSITTGAGSRRSSKSDDSKIHLKQTKCKACMEKWKIPLPSPKVLTPTLRSANASPSGSAERVVASPIPKTDSLRRISHLIEQEKYKLESYDRRYSNASNTSNQIKKKSIQSSSLDLVALNILDLEKIRHEIREKETKKKLEKFLGS